MSERRIARKREGCQRKAEQAKEGWIRRVEKREEREGGAYWGAAMGHPTLMAPRYPSRPGCRLPLIPHPALMRSDREERGPPAEGRTDRFPCSNIYVCREQRQPGGPLTARPFYFGGFLIRLMSSLVLWPNQIGLFIS